MIAIIDYGAGNVRSVKNALDVLGFSSKVTRCPKEILQASKVIFPGQGNFGAAMKHLDAFGLVPILKKIALTKPFLGICVGMQLLFEASEETPGVLGLGIIPGKVVRFSAGKKVPHMGWNQVEGNDYYFAHSYYCPFPDASFEVAAAEYAGEKICAAFYRDNLWAVQFHPEKSSGSGLQLLKRFCER